MSKNRNDAPARGAAHVATQVQPETQGGVINTAAARAAEQAAQSQGRNAATDLGLGSQPGALPDAGTRSRGLTLEGLGNIEEQESEPTPEEEGTGDKVVVLSDYISGAAGKTFGKGQVVRVSKLIPTFGDQKQLETSKATARRLFDLGAIRLATSDEARHTLIELDTLGETAVTRQERDARIAAEARIEELTEQLRQSRVVTADQGVPPIPPGREVVNTSTGG